MGYDYWSGRKPHLSGTEPKWPGSAQQRRHGRKQYETVSPALAVSPAPVGVRGALPG